MKNTKGNILYIGGFELPDLNAAAHRVLSNGKILSTLGYKIIYIGVSHNKSCSRDIFATKSTSNYGTDYKVKYPNSKIGWLKYLGKISEIIKIIEQNKIKIVIAYNYPALALYRLFKYCKRNNIKIISDCTEWYLAEGNLLFKSIKGLDSFFRMKIIQPKLDGIITISKFLYDFYSIQNNNVILVPPLVDLKNPKWENKGSKKDNTAIKFIYAGSPGGKMKDSLGIIISALGAIKNKSNRDFYLDIIGISFEDYNEIWAENPVPFSLKENIRFHGRLSNQDVINKLKEADFSVFIREDNLVTRAGFPTKFVEAISSGIPVLTNESSNVKDYLINGINGFLMDISTIDSLIESFDQVFLCNQNKIKEMKLECESNKTFNYTEYLSDFEKLFDFF